MITLLRKLIRVAVDLLNTIQVEQMVAAEDGVYVRTHMSVGQMLTRKVVQAILMVLAIGLALSPFGDDAETNQMIANLSLGAGRL